MTKNKVLLFIRVSSDKQDYNRQIVQLNEYCKTKGFDVIDTIKTIVSGRKAKREDIDQLKAMATAKMMDKVIVMELSRLGRRAKDIRSVIDHLHVNGISVIFKNLGIESLDENGNESFITNIIISIYAELAQEEVRLLSERTKSGLRHTVTKNGTKLGRKGPNKIPMIEKHADLAASINLGKSLSQCMAIHDVSRNTVIKIKRMVGK